MDKLRRSDPGILIRVSSELSYPAFAELAASYLSARSDRLQFFTSLAPPSAAGANAGANNKGGVVQTAPTQAQQQPQQADLHRANPSPLSNDSGNGNGYSPNGCSAATSLISEQTRAARASGE